MLKIKKIVLPVDFPVPSLHVIREAAVLARHFHSEIVILHVVDRSAEKSESGKAALNQFLVPEFEGIASRRILVKGDPAKAIVRTAESEKADLIMMPSYGYTFEQFLLGSVTAKVLNGAECPVWTGAHLVQSPLREFAIRNILCAVDLMAHSHKTVSWAVDMAAEFGARLTLANVTSSVEFWGPGGNYVNPEWRDALVDSASRALAKLQHEMGIKAETFIGSGDVPKVLSQAAAQTKADLLITGSRPYGGHLRTHGYSIICALPIPVLSL